MEHIVEMLVQLFSQTIPAELTVFVLSLMPIIELRGGILAAKLLNLQMLPAFFICLVGTLIPTPFILLFINKIFDWMRNTRFVWEDWTRSHQTVPPPAPEDRFPEKYIPAHRPESSPHCGGQPPEPWGICPFPLPDMRCCNAAD